MFPGEPDDAFRVCPELKTANGTASINDVVFIRGDGGNIWVGELLLNVAVHDEIFVVLSQWRRLEPAVSADPLLMRVAVEDHVVIKPASIVAGVCVYRLDVHRKSAYVYLPWEFRP